MRVLGAVGGVVACAGAGVAVAASPKPTGAPLNPPVEVAAAAATPAPSAGACGVNRPEMAGTPQLDPSLLAVVQQLRAATTRAQRQAILRGLTADQRQQITALQRGRAGAAGGGAQQGACDSGPAQPLPTIQPDVVAAGPGAVPITNSYVS